MKCLLTIALVVACFGSAHAELSSEPAISATLQKSWQDPRVKASLHRAINMYPALGQDESPLHREFLKAAIQRATKGLNDPNWPVIVATSTASKMGIFATAPAAAPAASAAPVSTPVGATSLSVAPTVRVRVEPVRPVSAADPMREEIERLNLHSVKRSMSGEIESAIAPDGVRVGAREARSFSEELSLERTRKLPPRRKHLNHEMDAVASVFEKKYFDEHGIYPTEAEVQEEIRKETETQQILTELRALRDEVANLKNERR
jgi:hypothetical protein